MGNIKKSNITSDDLERFNPFSQAYKQHDQGEEMLLNYLLDNGVVPVSWGIDLREMNGGLIFESERVDFEVYEGISEEDKAKLIDLKERKHEQESLEEAPLEAAGALYRSSDREFDFDDDWGLRKRQKYVRDNWITESEKEELNRLEDKFEKKALLELKTKNSEEWMRVINKRHYEKFRDIALSADVPLYIVFINLNKGIESAEIFDPRSEVKTGSDINCSRVDEEGRAPDKNEVVEFYERDKIRFNEVLSKW